MKTGNLRVLDHDWSPQNTEFNTKSTPWLKTPPLELNCGAVSCSSDDQYYMLGSSAHVYRHSKLKNRQKPEKGLSKMIENDRN
jgi:hypothetical protein